MNRTEEIIFGILSGAGAVFIALILALVLSIAIAFFQPYFIFVYLILYLFIVISTTFFYARGRFRTAYLPSTIIIFALVYFLVKLLITPIP